MLCAAGSCALPATNNGASSKEACQGLVPAPVDPSGQLVCPDKALTSYTPASCNYTGEGPGSD